ncbi:MAG: TIM barrel protein [Paracoccaceae bacterium]|nr:TIM barrel protein [Paracoccaceae bacterium]
MIRLAANITLLDWGLPLLDRVSKAGRRGFDGVECLFPYAEPAAVWVGELEAAGLPMALINTPAPDWDDGDRGCAAIPGREAVFAAQFAEACAYARQMGCKRMHVMSGITSDPRAFDLLVASLRLAARAAPDLTLLIEPLNPKDMPGYVLNDYDLAVEVLKAVDCANVGLQFDTWHALHIHGDPLAVWEKHQSHVRHVQISGWQARGAPDLTRPEEAGLLRAIGRGVYDGWVSAEYFDAPDAPTDWLNRANKLLA